eukprot:1607999-Pyramimonas_sp.AAC.1
MPTWKFDRSSLRVHFDFWANMATFRWWTIRGPTLNAPAQELCVAPDTKRTPNIILEIRSVTAQGSL